VTVKRSIKTKANVKKPTILLIEDDKLSAMVTKEMLNSIGCEVEIAKDGHEAKNLINKPKYDYNLVLIDILLPDMYGFDLFLY
jgi:CheY-like chemotaxis protein